MKKLILNLGKVLSKTEQKGINGGSPHCLKTDLKHETQTLTEGACEEESPVSTTIDY